MRLLLTVTFVVLLALPASGGQSGFEVAVTGDSILRLGETGLDRPDVFYDFEDSRQAFTRGSLGRASTWEAFKWLVPLVEPDGFLVIQDNALGVTDGRWADLMWAIEANTPDNVCLVGVLPVYVPNVATVGKVVKVPIPANTEALHGVDYQDAVWRRAQIMVEAFQTHPCRRWVKWNAQVETNPLLVYDGQHPTVEGSAWLNSEILRVTGNGITMGFWRVL